MSKYCYVKFIDSIKWYEKLILKFKKMQYEIIREGFNEIQIAYKKLFGKTFILKRTILPPQHVNCRCKIK